MRRTFAFSVGLLILAAGVVGIFADWSGGQTSKTVSQLTALTTPDAADLLLIADVSAVQSKKITVANFVNNGQAASASTKGFLTAADWSLFNAKLSSIVAGSITNAMLAGSIADSKLLTISTAGKVSDSALSANVPLKNGAPNTFTGTNVFPSIGIGSGVGSNKRFINFATTGVDMSTGDAFALQLQIDGGGGTGAGEHMIGADIRVTGTANMTNTGSPIGVNVIAAVNAGVVSDQLQVLSGSSQVYGTANSVWGTFDQIVTTGVGTIPVAATAAFHDIVSAGGPINNPTLFEGWIRKLGAGSITGVATGIKLANWSGTPATSYGIYMDSSIDIGSTRYALYSLSTSPSLLSGALTINPGTTPADALRLDMAQPGVAGQRDSHNFVMRGTSFDTAGHSVDWRQRVDVTNNAGASTWYLERSLDGGAYFPLLQASISEGTTRSLSLTGSFIGTSTITAVTGFRNNGTEANTGWVLRANSSNFVGAQLGFSDLNGNATVVQGGTGLTALGASLQQIRVNSSGSALEYFTPASLAWGGITGTLSAQSDLQAALDAKLPLAGGTMSGDLLFNGVNSGSATFPALASFVGNTTQYESTSQSAGLITHQVGGSATNISIAWTPKGTGAVILPTGAAANPSIVFSAATTTGFYNASGIGVAIGGVRTATFGSSFLQLDTAQLIINSATAHLDFSTDLFLTRNAAANLQLGAPAADTNALVVAQKLSVQNLLAGGISNQAGKDFTIAGSQGKGTGAGGSIIFQTSPAGSTGTAVNALVTGLTIGPGAFIDTPQVRVDGSVVFDVISGRLDIGNLGGFTSAVLGINNIIVGFGGITSSFPAIKRNAAALNFRLADDSADASITAAGAVFSGAVTATNLGFSYHPSKITIASTGALEFGNSIDSPDAFLTRNAAANLRFGVADAAAPVAQTLSVQNVASGTTNTAGQSLTIIGGLGTSTGVPGGLIFQTGALTPTSGTVVQTPVSRLTLGASKVLINNTVTTVTNVTAASNAVASGIVRYSVEVFNGTDLQLETGEFIYQVTNKGGTIANNTITFPTGYPKNTTTSGTLTIAWTITAANPALLQINANSSLTPSSGYPRVTYSVSNLTQQAIAVQ